MSTLEEVLKINKIISFFDDIKTDAFVQKNDLAVILKNDIAFDVDLDDQIMTINDKIKIMIYNDLGFISIINEKTEEEVKFKGSVHFGKRDGNYILLISIKGWLQ